MKYLAAIIFTFTFLFSAAPAYAADATFFGPIIPEACNCEEVTAPGGEVMTTAPAWGCVLQVIQNSINLAVSLSVILAVLYIVYSGFLFVISAGSPSAREAAKTRILNVVVGIVVLLSAWLIVDFIMKHLYVESDEFGPWNAILASDEAGGSCIQVAAPADPFSVVEGTNTLVAPGSIQQRICAAANSYRGASTASGPGGGVNACAWAVNNVLQRANVSTVDGDSVQDMENVLKGGRGTAIAQANAVCGDIVIVTSEARNHVGICINNGCTRTISNSSSRKTFEWISAPNFAPDYNLPFRIYRVTN